MLTHQLQATATRTAQTAVLGFGAALCLTVGLFFFTIAAWLFLNTVTTPLMAAVILGGAYSGLGFILLAVMSIRSSERRRERRAKTYAASQNAATADLTSIIAAFMTGLSAGKKARS